MEDLQEIGRKASALETETLETYPKGSYIFRWGRLTQTIIAIPAIETLLSSINT